MKYVSTFHLLLLSLSRDTVTRINADANMVVPCRCCYHVLEHRYHPFFPSTMSCHLFRVTLITSGRRSIHSLLLTITIPALGHPRLLPYPYCSLYSLILTTLIEGHFVKHDLNGKLSLHRMIGSLSCSGVVVPRWKGRQYFRNYHSERQPRTYRLVVGSPWCICTLFARLLSATYEPIGLKPYLPLSVEVTLACSSVGLYIDPFLDGLHMRGELSNSFKSSNPFRLLPFWKF
ncbi:hypothetical protein BGW80DRAFT_601488 [Lactifluus volemus]|nr:hypothetical protein BGW80DRAFT_601488 [Lactifluus volemus]